ncbi:hypothetical protein Tco_1031188 [Tanacetum coccineum]|uniref:Uncharacterized protein n=1 Tax=Tanacetum coccineum TaxID=301880 RepID=A0ABQ5GAJ4_9ASTR
MPILVLSSATSDVDAWVGRACNHFSCNSFVSCLTYLGLAADDFLNFLEDFVYEVNHRQQGVPSNLDQ